ncbi:MAG: hypothetical protein JO296_16535 [Pseudonocardiales bacterium]|nr:hypothetical protein [Pseudonocardiales bacterium]
MSAETRSAWYVASFRDHDTHEGVYVPATGQVHGRCGARFRPVPVGWPPRPGPLPGKPPDPGQICHACYRAALVDGRADQ